MVLQDEFKINGYINLLEEVDIENKIIELDDLFDVDQKPEELIGIFLSRKMDEIFFLLNGDSIDINQLCDEWDDRIRVFTIMNADSEFIHKLKFNIIQLIVCSTDSIDKNREKNLMISRKIIIKGDMSKIDHIIIDDADAIELPFHMIPPEKFIADEEKMNCLSKLMPSEPTLLELLTRDIKKVNKKETKGVWAKSFKEQEFNMIKEWIEA